MKKSICLNFLQLAAILSLSLVSYASAASFQCVNVHAEFSSVRANYPQIAEKINAIEEKTQNYWKPESKIPITIYLPMKQKDQFLSLDPKIKKTIEAVWDRMHDKAGFTQYMRTLSEDAAIEMALHPSTEDINLLKQGTFSRSAVLRVLFRRFKVEGNFEFSTLIPHRDAKVDAEGNLPKNTKRKKLDTNEGFREAVAQGPFFDKTFADDPHGMDTHFFQANYVAEVIWRESEGDPRLFWEFIGSKKGIHFWEILFDSGGSSYASPEYLGAIIRSSLSLM